MAAVKVITQPNSPFAGQTKDTTTTNSGRASCSITFVLTGTVSQIQADWVTLIAATITADSSIAFWGSGEL